MAVNPANKVRLQDSEFMMDDFYPSEGLKQINDDFHPLENLKKPSEGYGIHALFKQDVFDQTPSHFLLDLTTKGHVKPSPTEQITENQITPQATVTEQIVEEQTPSFWKKALYRLIPWLQPQLEAQSIFVSKTTELDPVTAIAQANRISHIPTLDEPKTAKNKPIQIAIQEIVESSKKKEQTQSLSQKQINEALLLMKGRTIEDIIAITIKMQLKLEEENGHVEEMTRNKYEECRKLYENMLPEIRDAIEKDEKIHGYLNTAKNIALFASVVCGIVAVAATFGVAAPGAAGVGLAVSGILTAITTGSEAYMKRRMNVGESKLTDMAFNKEHYNNLSDTARERIFQTAETDDFFKNILFNLEKRDKEAKRNI